MAKINMNLPARIGFAIRQTIQSVTVEISPSSPCNIKAALSDKSWTSLYSINPTEKTARNFNCVTAAGTAKGTAWLRSTAAYDVDQQQITLKLFKTMEHDMKTTLTSLAATAALSLTMISGANADSFGDCASTNAVTFDGSIVDAAIATPALSTLVDLVVAADLADALATTENITVFAPTNDAFAALPAELVDVVVGNTDLLTAVLTYHVTTGQQDPRKMSANIATRRATLNGQSVYFGRANGEARVNMAEVSCQPVKTDNGTVWVIDSVLLPAL